MSDTGPMILGADGRPAASPSARTKSACPRCRAPKDRRINAAGFGPPVIVCGACGYHFAGETEEP